MKMKLLKWLRGRKNLVGLLSVMALLLVGAVLILTIGQNRFQAENDEIVRGEFLQKFTAFSQALLNYIAHPSVLLALGIVLILFCWMLLRLFSNYFYMFRFCRFLDIIFDPRALESIPHSLVVLTVYFAFLKDPDHLRFIMLIAFAFISLPFIYKIMEDVFIIARQEGIVENYLILPLKDWQIALSFSRQKFSRLILVPLVFFVFLVIYWEFLFSSIGITGDEKSAAGIFYNNYNDGYLMNYPGLHDHLVFMQIGLFAVVVLLFLYLVFYFNSSPVTHLGKVKRLSRTEEQEKNKQENDLYRNDNQVLVSCRDVSLCTRAGETGGDREHPVIVENINLDIRKGENICIMGESGCGKTSLVREMAEIPVSGVFRNRGNIYRDGGGIFTIFQDVDLYLDPYQSLYYYVKKALKKSDREPEMLKNSREIVQYIFEVGLVGTLLQGIDKKKNMNEREIEAALVINDQQKLTRAWELLKNGLKAKKREQLSGGEKQKFYLLLAFILQPGILIADEIFTDVDQFSVEAIVSLLFSRSGQSTILFISHDIAMVKELVDKGQLQKVYYLKDKTFHPEVWLAGNQEDEGKIGNREPEMPGWALDMWNTYDEIEKAGGVIAASQDEKPPVFHIGPVTVQFGNGRHISFIPEPNPVIIRKGVNIAWEGVNGSGKSTLFKILTKLIPYKNGSIGYSSSKSRELKKYPRFQYAQQNQLVFQKTGNAIVEKTTVKNYLLSFLKKAGSHDEDKIIKLIKTFFPAKEPGAILNRGFKQLSVGEQRRILLIRALLLVNPGGMLFIDEAMRGMDIFLKKQLISHLKERHGLQVMLISHDRQLVKALCQERFYLTIEREAELTRISPARPGSVYK